MRFPFYRQLDQMDCGPTCLRMVIKYFGRNINLPRLKQLCQINRHGVSLLGISIAAEQIGFRSMGASLKTSDLREAELPCILHWRQNHYVVLYAIKKSSFFIADPAMGLIKLSEAEFNKNWASNDKREGIALFLSPTPLFYETQNDDTDKVKLSFLFHYLAHYRQLIFQLFLGLAIGSILQLIAPFLAQSVVDIGINTRNLNFIYIVIIAQAMLIIGRLSVDFIRSWILLHISIRVNISILTDFLIKLMRLPISYFDAKMTGDIMQRMVDQKKIESFLTGPMLNTLFSIFNLLVFSVVLIYYNTTIFFVFLTSSVLYLGWIAAFLRRRRDINYKSFGEYAKNQSMVVQLVNGMQEIKLNNCEQQKRWEWEHLQARIFKFNTKNLALSQYQQAGATFINESSNLLVTFLSAKAVIDGHLTLGAMMALQYIIGQLNAPIQQFIGFVQGFQDARISIERLNEIHGLGDEEPFDRDFEKALPDDLGLELNNLTFTYPGAGNEPVLKNIELSIPHSKTTAIVGMSGSGKTTILKLLLRFYEPEKGEIKIGDHLLKNVSYRTWRDSCGVVMQDGFIFSDTIERNIAVGDDYPDKRRLSKAIKVANVQDLIDRLPLGLNTRIGADGTGISSGQKQRLLIARAVYKDPDFIFFDEATNALDSNNELAIMDNLKDFFQGRTVVVVAHRLSTVKNADNIVVLHQGIIIEQGTHEQLTAIRGEYYRLIKNQLELGD